jgi:hypothetical protein
VYPDFYGFRSLGVGVLLALGGHELVQVWNRVDQLVDRIFVHTTLLSVGSGPSWARQVWTHTCQQDSGVSVGERWKWDHPLRAPPVWPHRAFHSSGAIPSEGGSFWGSDAGWDRNYREFAR